MGEGVRVFGFEMIPAPGIGCLETDVSVTGEEK